MKRNRSFAGVLPTVSSDNCSNYFCTQFFGNNLRNMGNRINDVLTRPVSFCPLYLPFGWSTLRKNLVDKN